MHTTINNNGDGNIINTGENTSIDSKINIIKNSKEKLSEFLSENKVEKEDIDKLLSVIDTEKPSENGIFGSKVNDWMKTMLSKSLDGTWKIAISAAGNLLATGIKSYYNIH